MRKPIAVRRPGLRRHARQSGYILLTLLLFVSLLVIAALAVYPTVAFQVRRDREEEMVHRGVQYSRAIKRYYKKFGTYPPTIEALQNTQNIRFLRKRYKDPVTGKDFKILRLTDIQMAFGPGIQGAQSIGGAGGLNSPFGSNTLGQSNPLSSNSTFGANAIAGPNAGNLNSSTPNTGAVQGGGAAADPASAGAQNTGNGVATGTEQDSTQSNGQNPNSNSPFVSASGQPTSGTFGGTPIVGVASVSKSESIRVFNKKNHYNEWQFVYDPMSDRGGLLNAPVQPGLQQGTAAIQVQGGQTGNPLNPTNNGFSNNPGMTSPLSGQGNASGTNQQAPQN